MIFFFGVSAFSKTSKNFVYYYKVFNEQGALRLVDVRWFLPENSFRCSLWSSVLTQPMSTVLGLLWWTLWSYNPPCMGSWLTWDLGYRYETLRGLLFLVELPYSQAQGW